MFRFSIFHCFLSFFSCVQRIFSQKSIIHQFWIEYRNQGKIHLIQFCSFHFDNIFYVCFHSNNVEYNTGVIFNDYFLFVCMFVSHFMSWFDDDGMLVDFLFESSLLFCSIDIDLCMQLDLDFLFQFYFPIK